MCLSSGDDLARTCSFGRIASSCAGVSLRKSSPTMESPSDGCKGMVMVSACKQSDKISSVRNK